MPHLDIFILQLRGIDTVSAIPSLCHDQTVYWLFVLITNGNLPEGGAARALLHRIVFASSSAQ